jgi:hypothetical protein
MSEVKNGSTDGMGAVNPLRPTIAATGVQVKGAALAEPAQFRMVLISFLSAGIGLIAGLIAYLLYNLIGVFTNIGFYHRFVFAFNSARNNHLGAWVIVTPVIGGIIVGFMAKYGSPKIKGHGIPEAMEAVLINRSRIQPRVAILKPISAAIPIGTGGPFGAEGPIIQTGGAVGSLIGQLVHTTASERKVLLACGAKPLDLASVLKKKIQPAFKRIGITGVGWHTFRHTVGSMLAEMGEYQLMVRDYLRHANPHVTNKYLQATTTSKRLAQRKLSHSARRVLSASKPTLVH